jgi:hypothetical protein
MFGGTSDGAGSGHGLTFDGDLPTLSGWER